MPPVEFPHAPQLPPLLTHSQSNAERPTLPLHPLLQPLPSSRSYWESNEHTQSPDELDQHRNNLQQLLNSERWAHHRTLFTLRNETARRDQLEHQISYMRQECQGLAIEWSAATKNLMQCDAERLDLVREVQALRSELESWQVAHQGMSGALTKAPQALPLDMTTARERQLAVRRKRNTVYISPTTHSTTAPIARSSSVYDEATVEPLFAYLKPSST